MPNLQVPSNLNQLAQAVTDGSNNSPLSLTRSPLSPTNSEIGRVGIAATTPAGLLQLAGSYVVASAPTQNAAIDKSNIDAAISAVGGYAGYAGTVCLQAGEYVIDSTISLDLIGGINIIGAGAGCTIIRMDNDATGTVVFDISRNSLCTIKNLTINSTQPGYIHTGIQVRSAASHATVEKVEILNMDKGVLLTSGSGLNNFRDVTIQNCNTGVKVGESGDDNWSNVNRFWGCMVTDFTTNGVWFANGQDNVLYGVNIAGETGAAPAVNFEALGKFSLGNRMYGCYLDNASGWIRINSNGNTIMSCQIGVGITWVSGTGSNSGNVVFGNLFVGQSFKEIILSNLGIGTTEPVYKVDVAGSIGNSSGAVTAFLHRGRNVSPWDSSFETGIAGFNVVNNTSVTQSNVQAYEGTNSLRIKRNDMAGAGGAYYAIGTQLKPGRVYTVSGYYRTVSGTGDFQVRLNFNAANAWDSAGTYREVAFPVSDAWTFFSINLTAVALTGGNNNFLWLGEYIDDTTTELYIDNIVFSEGSLPDAEASLLRTSIDGLASNFGGAVGIATTDPKSKFHVNGSIGVKVVTVATTPYTAADETVILVSIATARIYLPAASTVTGRTYYIKKTSSTGTTTIDGNGATIDGAATKPLTTQYQGMQIVSNGTAWFILALK
jgi:hypothetical protein